MFTFMYISVHTPAWGSLSTQMGCVCAAMPPHSLSVGCNVLEEDHLRSVHCRRSGRAFLGRSHTCTWKKTRLHIHWLSNCPPFYLHIWRKCNQHTSVWAKHS